jgi:hypothetical protein
MVMGSDQLGVEVENGLPVAILVEAVGDPNHLAGAPGARVCFNGHGIAEELEDFHLGEISNLEPAMEALRSGLKSNAQRSELSEVEQPGGLAVEGARIELNDQVPTGTGVIQATLGDLAVQADTRFGGHGGRNHERTPLEMPPPEGPRHRIRVLGTLFGSTEQRITRKERIDDLFAVTTFVSKENG